MYMHTIYSVIFIPRYLDSKICCICAVVAVTVFVQATTASLNRLSLDHDPWVQMLCEMATNSIECGAWKEAIFESIRVNIDMACSAQGLCEHVGGGIARE